MSTVLANTITAVGGGGSTVKVNNDSTYISDGGAVTDSNLVQGLCKAWVNADNDASRNYGFNFDEDYEQYPCKCGSDKCVGYIVREGSRWRIKKKEKSNK